MNACKKCQAFLYDYLQELAKIDSSFAKVTNIVNMKKHIYELIDAILRSQTTLNDWVLTAAKGEIDMRIHLIHKPGTREEANILTFVMLKHVGVGFCEELKYMEDLVLSTEMVKMKHQDKWIEKRDLFLATLLSPLVFQLDEIHTEHSGKRNPTPLKEYSFQSEIDLLYS